jgi:GT2 family glycosyltransferase
LKRGLLDEILSFQSRTRGCESLAELLALPTIGDDPNDDNRPRVTVILNHFKRKTLCAQLDAILNQTLPVHSVWVLSLGGPGEDRLRAIAAGYADPRIAFVGSGHNFGYFGRFQLALQPPEGTDFVYVLDDDMIPGRRVVEILAHAARTAKYSNAVLGSIGRILPFRQSDGSFPSYRKLSSKEAGLYVPDPKYGLVVDRVLQVDFLSSSWFLAADLVKTIFIETPFTFATGEDLHLR